MTRIAYIYDFLRCLEFNIDIMANLNDSEQNTIIREWEEAGFIQSKGKLGGWWVYGLSD